MNVMCHSGFYAGSFFNWPIVSDRLSKAELRARVGRPQTS